MIYLLNNLEDNLSAIQDNALNTDFILVIRYGMIKIK